MQPVRFHFSPEPAQPLPVISASTAGFALQFIVCFKYFCRRSDGASANHTVNVSELKTIDAAMESKLSALAGAHGEAVCLFLLE